jgi:hypothetical protein
MPFDLATAKPVASGGFDLKTAKPVVPTASQDSPGMLDSIKQGAVNLAAGAVRGAGSIGATILAPVDMISDAMDGKGLSLASNRQRRADIDAGLTSLVGSDPNSLLYKTGKLGGEVAGTAGVGGVLANGVRAAAPALESVGIAAPTLQRLANAVETSGFRTGAPAATTTGQRLADIATRATGGAITGGTSAALINPDSAGTGAVVGAVLPPAIAGSGKVLNQAGKGLYALAQPFTKAGQENLAGRIINKFAEDGPTTLDMTQHVPGSTPTLAEATGNAGIARLQSAARDVKPNIFAEREANNAAARNAIFDEAAGDAGKLDFFKASRGQAADDLYSEALKTDIAANMTPFIKGQVTQLLKRPSVQDALQTAERWALERGEKPDVGGSMAGLHDMKTALDDQISAAVRAGKGGEAKALSNTKDKLLMVMEKLSPDYQQARITYSEMSKPINQMETLQGLRLTDAQGNMTLSKVQNAIDNLEQRMTQSGTDPAKALTADQINTLKSIRDDLLRKSRASAGKSAGSNTFQNIATDNIISSILPGKMGEVVGNKVGGVAGQFGRLIYSGPNEAVRNRLAELMLDPPAATAAMESAGQPMLQQIAWPNVTALSSSGRPALQLLYRAAPPIATSR